MTKHIHNTMIFIVLILLSVSCAGAIEQNSKTQNKGAGEIDNSSSTVNNYNVSQRPLPVYLAALSNLNDYSLFANGGWDGNWYAGFNVCWMQELPKPAPGNYARAFVGAKLGRMKTRPIAGKPVWEKEPIPGSIYISVNATPSWKQANSFFLVDSRDIPLEGDPENALEGVGESRWFWTEVPLKAISSEGSNFVALWSPTEYFVSTASSPILAGGWGSNNVSSWLNNDVKGYPPLDPKGALKTAISAFEPAIAIKLVPDGTQQDIYVKIRQITDGRAKTPNKTFFASVTGEEIEKAWLELMPVISSTAIIITNNDKQAKLKANDKTKNTEPVPNTIKAEDLVWKKHGAYVYSTPFMFTLKPDTLIDGKMKVRVSASDIWGNTGSSDPVEIEVSRPPVQKK